MVAEGTPTEKVVVVVGTEILVMQNSDFRAFWAGNVDSWKKLVDVDVICGQIAVEAGKRLRELGPGVAWDAIYCMFLCA